MPDQRVVASLADSIRRISGHLFVIQRSKSRRDQDLIDVVLPLGRTVMHIGEDVAAVLDLPYDTMRRGFYVRDVGMTIAALSRALYDRPDMLTWQSL